MSKTGWLALVSLVAALTFGGSTAHAQVRSALASPRTELALEEETFVAESVGTRAGRVGAEIGFGLGGLVLTTGVAAALGAALNEPCGASPWQFLCGPTGGAIMGGLVGTFLGGALLPAFLTLGGTAAGGRGHAGGAYLGFLVGGGAAAGTIALGALGMTQIGGAGGDALLWSSIVLGTLMTMTGTIVGYELTHHAATRGPSVTPSLAVDGNGATIGATGTF